MELGKQGIHPRGRSGRCVIEFLRRLTATDDDGGRVETRRVAFDPGAYTLLLLSIENAEFYVTSFVADPVPDRVETLYFGCFHNGSGSVEGNLKPQGDLVG